MDVLRELVVAVPSKSSGSRDYSQKFLAPIYVHTFVYTLVVNTLSRSPHTPVTSARAGSREDRLRLARVEAVKLPSPSGTAPDDPESAPDSSGMAPR